MGTVSNLNPPAHPNMTVDQALESARLRGLSSVLIVGYDPEGNLVVRSSHMSRNEALWLAVKAQQHALGDLD
jgi:hypothetical protein